MALFSPRLPSATHTFLRKPSRLARAMGGYVPMDQAHVRDMEVWPLQRKKKDGAARPVLTDAAATGEPGSKGWQWYPSREALEALDGRLGPGHGGHVPALCRDLAARLISRRDRYVMRGGESLWGAFRICDFLARIGDRRAVGVLRRATHGGTSQGYLRATQAILLRWYAAAALKLIDVQARPEPERRELAKAWLRHCFATPEEHFMARDRLIPYLNSLLGAERQTVYEGLVPSLTDVWLIHDARRLAR